MTTAGRTGLRQVPETFHRLAAAGVSGAGVVRR